MAVKWTLFQRNEFHTSLKYVIKVLLGTMKKHEIIGNSRTVAKISQTAWRLISLYLLDFSKQCFLDLLIRLIIWNTSKFSDKEDS